MLLYPHNGTLYFQAGNGNNFGQAANNTRAEVSYTIPASGRYIIEVHGSNTADQGILYINGTEVDSAAFTAGALGGIDGGAAGRCENAVCDNRADMTVQVVGVSSSATSSAMSTFYFYEFTYATGGNRLITNRFPLAAYLAGDIHTTRLQRLACVLSWRRAILGFCMRSAMHRLLPSFTCTRVSSTRALGRQLIPLRNGTH